MEPSLLQEAEQPSSPCLQERGSILGFVFVAVLWMHSHSSMSPCTEDSASGCSTAGEASPAQSRGMGISSLRPLTAHLWMQPRIRLAFWAGRAHCWLVSSSHPPVLPGLMEQDYAQSFHPLACFGGGCSLIPATDPALGFVPTAQPVEVSVDGIPSLCCVTAPHSLVSLGCTQPHC